MGKYAPAILLAAAVIVALITSVATYRWLQSEKEVGEVREVEGVSVAVALSNLAPGVVLQKEMVEMEDFMKGSLPEGSYFTEKSQVDGRVIISPVKQGEPVLRSRLAPETLAQGGVPAVIAPQKRALAVKVDKVIGVSGFIKPGNRVDVLVTVPHPENQERFTKTVLENMLVLAIGTQMEQPDKNQPPVQVDVITMEVTPEEAEKLALASTEGRIMMALRGYTDDVEVFTKGETVETLLAAYTKADEKKRTVRRSTAPARKPAPRKKVSRPVERAFTVWVINGSAVETSKVSGGE